jgi:hypothetical protein
VPNQKSVKETVKMLNNLVFRSKNISRSDGNARKYTGEKSNLSSNPDTNMLGLKIKYQGSVTRESTVFGKP